MIPGKYKVKNESAFLWANEIFSYLFNLTPMTEYFYSCVRKYFLNVKKVAISWIAEPLMQEDGIYARSFVVHAFHLLSKSSKDRGFTDLIRTMLPKTKKCFSDSNARNYIRGFKFTIETPNFPPDQCSSIMFERWKLNRYCMWNLSWEIKWRHHSCSEQPAKFANPSLSPTTDHK